MTGAALFVVFRSYQVLSSIDTCGTIVQTTEPVTMVTVHCTESVLRATKPRASVAPLRAVPFALVAEARHTRLRCVLI